MGMNRFDDAEQMLREVYPFLSDHVDVVDVYRGLLLKARKWDELEEVEKRIEESKDLCDVRDLDLPARDEYATPAGQEGSADISPQETSDHVHDEGHEDA